MIKNYRTLVVFMFMKTWQKVALIQQEQNNTKNGEKFHTRELMRQ